MANPADQAKQFLEDNEHSVDALDPNVDPVSQLRADVAALTKRVQALEERPAGT
jgi:ubiquinone biosynthesis protein UbiJ